MAIMDHVAQNGQGQRGRIAPPLPEHTFRDSGVTIRIRKIGPMTQQRLAQQIQKEFPKPQPPVITTELGDEANPADPAYAEAIEQWQRSQGLALNERLMVLAALDCEVTIDDAVRAEIARTRRHLEHFGIWQDDPKLTPEENERVLYVLHIACASPDDLREFGHVLTERSTPTEEAVQRHIATFPGDVSGPGRVQLPPDPALGDSA